jgi:hypothetical protein
MLFFFNLSLSGREDEYLKVESYLPNRVVQQKLREDWPMLLSQAHIQYGTGKSELIARVSSQY